MCYNSITQSIFIINDSIVSWQLRLFSVPLPKRFNCTIICDILVLLPNVCLQFIYTWQDARILYLKYFSFWRIAITSSRITYLVQIKSFEEKYFIVKFLKSLLENVRPLHDIIINKKHKLYNRNNMQRRFKLNPSFNKLKATWP